MKDFDGEIRRFDLGVKLNNFINASSKKSFTRDVLVNFLMDQVHHPEFFGKFQRITLLKKTISHTDYFYKYKRGVFTFYKVESNIDRGIKQITRLINDDDDLIDIFKKCYQSDIHDMVELWKLHIEPHPVNKKFQGMLDFIFKYIEYKKQIKQEKTIIDDKKKHPEGFECDCK